MMGDWKNIQVKYSARNNLLDPDRKKIINRWSDKIISLQGPSPTKIYLGNISFYFIWKHKDKNVMLNLETGMVSISLGNSRYFKKVKCE
jgi:hypothetical protein